MIGERQNFAADDLAGFVALAGNQQHVTAFELADATADRLGAIADFSRALGLREDGGTDGGGLLAARIVVGDDDPIGIFNGNTPHDRSFALVAVAAGAEYDNELALGIGPQSVKRLLQRVGLVGIVDEDGSTALGIGPQSVKRLLQRVG